MMYNYSMRVGLITFNAGYIHKALGLRWLYVTATKDQTPVLLEFTTKTSVSEAVSIIQENNLDVLAFSVSIWNAALTKEVIQELLKDQPRRIILGGPEVTYDNDDWFDLGIEAIILGEGEKAFWDYLKSGQASGAKTAKGQAAMVVRTPLSWLEQFSDPYTLDIDKDTMEKRYLYIETSRGCPFRCSYCQASLDKPVRYFSLPYLKNVFSKLQNYQPKQVKFLDRTFNADKNWAKSIQELVCDFFTCSFQCEIMPEPLSSDEKQRMILPAYKKRFRYEIGIQSFSPEVLKEIGRPQNNEAAIENLKYLLNNGVVCHVDLIAGLPYETLESFQKSFHMLYSLAPSELQLGILKVLKGTGMHANAKDYELVYHPQPPYEVIRTKWMSEADIQACRDAAFGLDRLSRKHNFKTTVDAVLQKGVAPFLCYQSIGAALRKQEKPENLYATYQTIHDALGKWLNQDELKQRLNFDFFLHVRVRCAAPFPLLSLDQKKHCSRDLIKKDFLKQEQLPYLVMEQVRIDDTSVILCCVLSRQQDEARQYVYNIQDGSFKEIYR